MRTWGWMSVALLALGLGCGEAPDDDGAAAPDAGIDQPEDPDGEDDVGPEPGDGETEPDADARCDGDRGEPGDRVLVISHDGLPRRVLVHVPASYDPSEPAMLVLNFHGFSSADWQQAALTHMNAEADERGFVVAYPQGVAASWNAGDCCGTAWVDAVDDVGFTVALLDRLEADYCIDSSRVYATGMSNGGFFSHRLACELSDRIAAIAPVAGVLGVDECQPARPVPVWHFHGNADLVVPYVGGAPGAPLGDGLVFRSVADTLETWRVVNGCEAEPAVTVDENDIVCVEWQGCGAPTRLCTVELGGHTWPGGLPLPAFGYTTYNLDATAEMLDFFAANPMP